MKELNQQTPIQWNRFLTLCRSSPQKSHDFLQASSELKMLQSQPSPPLGSIEIYGRQLLHQDDSGEILLMTWQEDRFCAVHDHDHSQGYVFFLQGEFLEREWRWQGQKLQRISSQKLSSPQFAEVEKGRIHDMKAVHKGVSLHVYFPPIHQMRVFDVAAQKTYLLGEGAGAWLPAAESSIIEIQTWNP